MNQLLLRHMQYFNEYKPPQVNEKTINQQKKVYDLDFKIFCIESERIY